MVNFRVESPRIAHLILEKVYYLALVVLEKVYGIVSSIPYGKVLTYGQIARLADCPDHSRLVGRVMRGTSTTMCLPCHRVVNSQGRMVPGWVWQKTLLENEEVKIKANGCVDMSVSLWNVMEEEAWT